MRRYLLIAGVLFIIAVSFAWMGCGDSGSTDGSTDGDNTTNSGNPKMTIETDKGNIVIELFPDSAPNTVDHIKDLVNQQFYDDMMISRVQADFAIQMGDPDCRRNSSLFLQECDLSGGSGTTVGLEPSNLTHNRGSVSMAHPTNNPNGNDSQFFICLNTTSCQNSKLDGNFTIFGQVTSGMDVVDQISCTISNQDLGLCVPGTGDFMNRVTVSE
ncbi:MAG: peptidylprolyl isomerase [Nitrospirota bacterium]